MSFFLSLLLTTQAVALPGDEAVPPVDWARQLGIEEEQRDPATGEFPVAPYRQSNANAGATPVGGNRLADQFGGQAGIRDVTDRLVAISLEDPRISATFKGHDMVRLRRTLFEQVCYLLNAGCDYSGRDMQSAHRDMGLQMDDLNALVENLQQAMREKRIPFSSQNRLLAKLAPMKNDVVQP